MPSPVMPDWEEGFGGHSLVMDVIAYRKLFWIAVRALLCRVEPNVFAVVHLDLINMLPSGMMDAKRNNKDGANVGGTRDGLRSLFVCVVCRFLVFR